MNGKKYISLLYKNFLNIHMTIQKRRKITQEICIFLINLRIDH